MKPAVSESVLLRRLALKRATIEDLTIIRQKCGNGYTFIHVTGVSVSDPGLRARLVKLVLPPAWTDVRISPHDRYHLQAVGRDAAGRLQYVYHEAWTEVRTALKGDRLARFGGALPAIRQQIATDLRRRDLDFNRVAAAALRLVDKALLRAGHEQYAKKGGGRGVATLLKNNVELVGDRTELNFTGKSGREIALTVADRSLARVVGELKAVKGRRLFKFRGGNGWRNLTAGDLNSYIKDAAGSDVSTKDFRTFAASAFALRLLAGQPAPASEHKCKRLLAQTARQVSEKLHNTPQIARTSYIHPPILETASANGLDDKLLKGPARTGLDEAETGLMRFLERARGK